MLRPVVELDQLWMGEMRAVSVEGRRVLLVNTDGEVRAYEDRCAHAGVPLSGGRLEGCRLLCSAHLWEYDCRNGRGLNPISAQLRPFEVVVRDGLIYVDVERNGP